MGGGLVMPGKLRGRGFIGGREEPRSLPPVCAWARDRPAAQVCARAGDRPTTFCCTGGRSNQMSHQVRTGLLGLTVIGVILYSIVAATL